MMGKIKLLGDPIDPQERWRHLNSRCHPETPMWCVVEENKGLLVVVCARCRQIVARFGVHDPPEVEGHGTH